MIPLLLVEILDSLVRLQFLDTACKLLTSQCFHHIVWKIQPVPWDKVGMTCAIWTTKFAQNSRATTTWTLRNSEGDLPRTMWCNTANSMLVQCEAVDYCPGAKASRGKTSTLLLAFLKWIKPFLSSTHISWADTGRSSSWFLICFISHPLRSTILPCSILPETSLMYTTNHSALWNSCSYRLLSVQQTWPQLLPKTLKLVRSLVHMLVFVRGNIRNLSIHGEIFICAGTCLSQCVMSLAVPRNVPFDWIRIEVWPDSKSRWRANTHLVLHHLWVAVVDRSIAVSRIASHSPAHSLTWMSYFVFYARHNHLYVHLCVT